MSRRECLGTAAVRRPPLLLLLVMAGVGWSQDTVWTRRFDTGRDDHGGAGAVDPLGNPVVGGGNWNPEEPDSATFTVVKYIPSGDLVWARTYDSEAPDDEGLDIAADAHGSIVVAGWYLYPDDSCGGQLVKYDRDGNLLWARRYCHARYTMLGGVVIDDSMNIFAAGIACDTPWVWDAVLLKYSADGELAWVRSYDFGSDYEWLYELAWDREGNLVGVGTSNTWPGYEILIVKYDRDGDTIWSRRLRPCVGQTGSGIAVDAENNVIITGTGDHGVGSPPVCLTMKLSPGGDLLWSRVYQPRDAWTDGLGVAIDPAGDILVVGHLKLLGGTESCLLLKYAPAGDTVWTRRYQLDSLRAYGYEVTLADPDALYVFGTVADPDYTNYDMLVMRLRYSAAIESPEPGRKAAAWAQLRAASPLRKGESLRLTLEMAGDCRVSLCDAAGRCIRVLHSGLLEPGEHAFSLADIPAGIYFCRVESGEKCLSRKVVLTAGR